jgi:hypothetical protein
LVSTLQNPKHCAKPQTVGHAQTSDRDDRDSLAKPIAGFWYKVIINQNTGPRLVARLHGLVDPSTPACGAHSPRPASSTSPPLISTMRILSICTIHADMVLSRSWGTTTTRYVTLRGRCHKVGSNCATWPYLGPRLGPHCGLNLHCTSCVFGRAGALECVLRAAWGVGAVVQDCATQDTPRNFFKVEFRYRWLMLETRAFHYSRLQAT